MKLSQLNSNLLHKSHMFDEQVADINDILMDKKKEKRDKTSSKGNRKVKRESSKKIKAVPIVPNSSRTTERGLLADKQLSGSDEDE